MDRINKSIINFGDFIEKKYKVIWVLIFILALILNTFKLGEIPTGINCDEAGMTYDAYCIANYGTDRFQNKFPVYFTNFGDGQNALYTYLTAILIKIFGSYNNIIIRIPALIISMCEVVIAYLLVNKFRSKKESLLFMLLVTISPWHIMKSRWALESYLFSPFLLFSVYALCKAVMDANKKILKYFIAGLLFGITLYTYAISYIVVPIFLLGMLLYLIKLKKVKAIEAMTLAFPFIIMAIPLILVQLVQRDIIKPIYSFITIQKLFFYRAGELNIHNIVINLSTVKYVFLCDCLNYNSLKEVGTLYYIGTFGMFLGLIFEIIDINGKTEHKDKKLRKKQNKDLNSNTDLNLDLNSNKDLAIDLNLDLDLDIIMLINFISNFVIMLLTEVNANKGNGIFISATYFGLVAFRNIYKKRKELFIIMLIIYLISFVSFLQLYFVKHKYGFKPFWDNGAVKAFKEIGDTNKKIYGDEILYIYDIYENPITPEEFNRKLLFENKYVVGFSNYEEITIDVNNVDENAIYLTYNKRKADALVEKGFKYEKFDYCYLLSKN